MYNPWSTATVRFRRSAAVLAAAALFSMSCAAGPAADRSAEVLPLEEGVLRLAGSLMAGLTAAEGTRPVVAVDRFSDAETGEVPRAAERIESILLKGADNRYPPFRLVRLTPEYPETAGYLIAGTLSPEGTGKDVYRLSGAVKDLRRNRLVGEASVLISEPGLDYTPMAVFKESPFFDPRYRKGAAASEPRREGTPAAFSEYSTRTLALLRAASDAYEDNDYRRSLELFEEAALRPDGNTLRAYAGLFLVREKLGMAKEADDAFQSIMAISISRYRLITVRFLFQVDSVDFWNGAQNDAQYMHWLRRIGDYFAGTDHCLQIVGHCSNTGPETWNRSLSLMRAQKIQRLLAGALPGSKTRTIAVGKGSTENVVGTGTDDDRDVLDRRVEILVVSCPG